MLKKKHLKMHTSLTTLLEVEALELCMLETEDVMDCP